MTHFAATPIGFAIVVGLGLLNGCSGESAFESRPDDHAHGVPLVITREPAPGEVEAIGRAVLATPRLPWHQAGIVLWEPGPNDRTGEVVKVGDRYVIRVDGRHPSACVVIHEAIEHVFPHALGWGWNREHDRPWLTTWAREIKDATGCEGDE